MITGSPMPAKRPVDQWIDQVVTAFPKLTRPEAVVLALYSFGVIQAHRCGLNGVAAAEIPRLGLQFSTVRSRRQEFYQPAYAKSDRDHRRQLEVTTTERCPFRKSLISRGRRKSLPGNDWYWRRICKTDIE
jgi:hypothetical protein